MRRYRPLIVGSILSAALLTAFYELAADFAGSSVVVRFDAIVSSAIQSLRAPALTLLMRVITFLGDTPAVAFATFVLFVVLIWRGRWFEANYAAAVVIVVGALSVVTKGIFERPRPPVENALIALPSSFSFPSGHTLGSLALAWVLGHAVLTSRSLPAEKKRWLLVPIVLYPVLVGTSRVYLGVHWPSDVLASWLLGGAWIALATGAAITWAPPGAMGRDGV